MYPQLTTKVRRSLILAATTLAVGALGTTTAAHATSTVSATSAAPTTCDAMAETTDAMAEEDAMAETTDAMAEEDAMAETTDAMAEEDAMAETTDAMAEEDAMAETTDAMAEEDAMAETTDAMAEEDAMAETTDAMAEEDAMAETTDAMAEEDAMAETTDAMAEPGDLLAVAGDAELSTFVAAVEAAGLSDVLTGDGPLTVFAPSNEAFAMYLSETGIDEAALLADTEALAALLSGHVVEGEVTAEALVAADGLCLTTVAGTELPVTVDDDSAVVGQATVLDAGHPASNGVVYIVDHVITG